MANTDVMLEGRRNHNKVQKMLVAFLELTYLINFSMQAAIYGSDRNG